MPRHDYLCSACGWVLRDQERSIVEGARARLPVCFNCDVPMEWMPKARFDLRSDSPSSAFPKFQTFDGQNHPVEVTSLHDIRRLERESEQQAADGEGQAIRFRAFAQDRSNLLDNTFGDIPRERPSEAAKKKFGLQGGARPVDGSSGEPDIPYGPGVTDKNASALKE